MRSRKPAKTARRKTSSEKTGDAIIIRACHGIEEFEACVRVERAVWQSSDIDVVPIPLFVVASETGGQVLGAFHGANLVGFTMAIAGWRARKPFLHSHMTAVLDGFRDRGVGRRLKLHQREDALARGIALIEWTFDPLVLKNAFFNFMRLGAIARRYLPNAYGITTSPLHASLPTDRLVAEWHLRSDRVRRVLAGKPASALASRKAVRITIPSNLEGARSGEPVPLSQIQAGVRAQFLRWFRKGYVAIGVQPREGGVDYILEPGSSV
jgi:predicted GNAT superfamily acetyltransferase